MLGTTNKGIAAEYIAMADVMLSGYVPETPCSPISVHDFTINGFKVQVKCGINDGTRVAADIRRPSASRKYYEVEEVDIFAIVDLSTRKVAYIHRSELIYSRQLKLFVTDVFCRAGMPRKYEPLYFNDYLDIARVLKSEVSEDGAA